MKKIMQIGNISNSSHQSYRLYSPQGLSPCLRTAQGGGNFPLILQAIPCRRAFIGWTRTKQGKISKLHIRNTSPTVTANPRGNTTILAIDAKMVIEKGNKKYLLRIRKLMPKELFRLMGVPEPKINKILSCDDKGAQILSNTQLQKLAGNSLVPSVVCAILEKALFSQDSKNEIKQPTLFDELWNEQNF